jgi:nifR3 family TIM-barrel protein
MNLGSLNLENKLILAPLQNVTTAPFRRLCRQFYKIGLVSVPMIYTKGIVSNPKSIEHELLSIEEEGPISVQLIGNDKEALIKSIDFLESYRFDVLDINAGCPSKRAIKAKEGGYLLQDLKRLEELLKTAVKVSSRPVSLKTRIGFKTSSNLRGLANVINCSGIDFATIHARCVKYRFNENKLDLDALKRLREFVNIPLVGNGDITTPQFAKHFLDYTNVDALMIGRGAIGNPEIFHQLDKFIEEGIEIPSQKNINLMRKYLKMYEQILDKFLENIQLPFPHEEYKFTELKRNSIWFTKNTKESTSYRTELSKAKNLKQLRSKLDYIFNN